jgi:aldehyde:ferredoxin oxidoreductase
MFGFVGKILRVNLTTGRISEEELQESDGSIWGPGGWLPRFCSRKTKKASTRFTPPIG